MEININKYVEDYICKANNKIAELSTEATDMLLKTNCNCDIQDIINDILDINSSMFVIDRRWNKILPTFGYHNHLLSLYEKNTIKKIIAFIDKYTIRYDMNDAGSIVYPLYSLSLVPCAGGGGSGVVVPPVSGTSYLLQDEFYYDQDNLDTTFELTNPAHQIVMVTLNGQVLANDGVLWYSTLNHETHEYSVTLNFDLETEGYVQVFYITAPGAAISPITGDITSGEVHAIVQSYVDDLQAQIDAIAADSGIGEEVQAEIDAINDTLTGLHPVAFSGQFDDVEGLPALSLVTPDVDGLPTIPIDQFDTVIVKDESTGGIFNYYPSAVDLEVDDVTVFQAIDGGYWKRQFEGALQVGWYGVKGDGTDESVVVQNMLNRLPEDAIIEWGNKEYRFVGVVAPGSIRSLVMIFNKTVWKYPIRNESTTPSEWWRYFDAQGHENSQIWLKNIRKVELIGDLTMDGEASSGNTYNRNEDVYFGQGLASIWRVEAHSVSLKGDPLGYTTMTNAPNSWSVTETTLSVNHPSGDLNYRGAWVRFSRDPQYRYRIAFRLEIEAGTIWYNHLGGISNPKTASGTFFHDIPATGPGTIANQDFYWFSYAGSVATVHVEGVYQLEDIFTDTYFKTSGNFTLTDHGFAAGYIFTGNSLVPSYNKVTLSDWNIIDTPVGGIQCAGYYNTVEYKNWFVSDPYGKSWDGFDDEGARGFGVSSANSQNPATYTENMIVQDFTAYYGWIPAIMASKSTMFRNISIRKFGRFIGGDGLERSLGEPDGTGYDLPLVPGGSPTKVDFRWLVPNQNIVMENIRFTETSLFGGHGNRTWSAFWFQGGVKRGVIRSCIVDTGVTLAGRGGGNPTGIESWANRNIMKDSIILNDGYVTFGSQGRGSRLENCHFQREPILKSAIVDFVFPDYTGSPRVGVTISGTHNPSYNTTDLGAGDNFEPNIIEKCTFTNRAIFPEMGNSITWFLDCVFEEGSNVPVSGSDVNNNFHFRFINCKRPVVYNYAVPQDRRATSSCFFKDSEIIILGYTGNTADLENSNSSIRAVLANTTMSWDNLKIYGANGTLYHDLKGFEWLVQPASASAFGIKGAWYETVTNRYDHDGTEWIATAKTAGTF
jgi:hypothetical protein